MKVIKRFYSDWLCCTWIPATNSDNQRSLNHREDFEGNQRHVCRQLQYITAISLKLAYIMMSSEALGPEPSKCGDSHRAAAFSSTKSEHIALQWRDYKTILLEVIVSPRRSGECVELRRAHWMPACLSTCSTAWSKGDVKDKLSAQNNPTERV